MHKIGILSDIHGYWDDRYLQYFQSCDEIWIAGDIGSIDVYNRLKAYKPVRAVFGNIDGQDLRYEIHESEVFTCEKVKVVMKHIGGRPPKYDAHALNLISEHHPNLFVCGHSHILQVKYDDNHQLLYVNPGAAGKYGFHKVRTLFRLTIDGDKFTDLEVIELEKGL